MTERWLETLRARPASFRGVPFSVEAVEYTGGRREVEHVFPQRDDSYFESLGRKRREFPIDAYLSGSNYFVDKQNLIDALEAEGIGILVHPYYGIRKVIVDDFSIRDIAREGRYCIISIIFKEAEEAPKAILESVEEELKAKASVTIEEVKTTFPELFSVDNMPSFFVTEAAGWIEDVSENFVSSLSVIGQVEDYIQETSAFIERVQDFADSAVSYVNDPLSLVNELTTIYSDVLEITESVEDLYSYFGTLFEFGLDYDDMIQTTQIRVKQLENRNNFVDLVRASAIVSAAKIAGQKDYESDEAAKTDRDSLLNQIDSVTSSTLDDSIFRNLLSLKISVRKLVNISQRKVISMNVPVSVPELVFSFRLYGTPEEPIAERNNIEHPGFISGSAIKVLSNV